MVMPHPMVSKGVSVWVLHKCSRTNYWQGALYRACEIIFSWDKSPLALRFALRPETIQILPPTYSGEIDVKWFKVLKGGLVEQGLG